jgi:hypothetical protein
VASPVAARRERAQGRRRALTFSGMCPAGFAARRDRPAWPLPPWLARQPPRDGVAPQRPPVASWGDRGQVVATQGGAAAAPWSGGGKWPS